MGLGVGQLKLRIGFTGTQNGMTHRQMRAVRLCIQEIVASSGNIPWELHHGDCVGADAQAHHIGQELGARIIIHPPIKSDLQANCTGAYITFPPQEYLVRNRDIVKWTQLLIAATQHDLEVLRSGTWSTIRCARRFKRSVIIVYPDGRVVEDML